MYIDMKEVLIFKYYLEVSFRVKSIINTEFQHNF